MISSHLLAVLVAVVLLQAKTILSTTPATTEYVPCNTLDVMQPSYVSDDDIKIESSANVPYNNKTFIRPDAREAFDTLSKEVKITLTLPESDLATFKLKDPKGVYDYVMYYEYNNFGSIESDTVVDGVSDKPHGDGQFYPDAKLVFRRKLKAKKLIIMVLNKNPGKSMSFKVELKVCAEPCKTGQKWYAPAEKCFPSLTIRTRGGNAHFAYCAVPYKYKGKWEARCVQGKYGPWCGTTHDYDKDGKWGYCADKCQTHDKKTVYEGDTWTSGGILYVCQKNGKAKKSNCHFPFTYEGLVYENKCAGLYHPWCYTDKDQKKKEYCS